MLDSTIILILLVLSSLASAQQTFGTQDVETRGTNDKVNLDGVGGGGQPRAIHSQRHLSPHRMMHFGKRPQIIPPPTIMTPQRVYDLYQRAQQPMQLEPIVIPVQQPQQQQLQPDKYPYLLSLELERGQTLQALPEAADAFELLQPSRNLVYNFVPQQVALDRLRAQDEERGSSRLMNMDDNLTNEDVSSSDSSANSDRSRSQDDNGSSPQRAISLSQRSVPRLSLPKAYISNLYGRQSVSAPGFSSYNKKAEPKNNLFMHFGRK